MAWWLEKRDRKLYPEYYKEKEEDEKLIESSDEWDNDSYNPWGDDSDDEDEKPKPRPAPAGTQSMSETPSSGDAGSSENTGTSTAPACLYGAAVAPAMNLHTRSLPQRLRLRRGHSAVPRPDPEPPSGGLPPSPLNHHAPRKRRSRKHPSQSLRITPSALPVTDVQGTSIRTARRRRPVKHTPYRARNSFHGR